MRNKRIPAGTGLIRDPAEWARESGWLSKRQVETLKSRGLFLTRAERGSLLACINGELDNDDGRADPYMNALRRVVRKLDQTRA